MSNENIYSRCLLEQRGKAKTFPSCYWREGFYIPDDSNPKFILRELKIVMLLRESIM